MDSVETPTCGRPHLRLEHARELARIAARADKLHEELLKATARVAYIVDQLSTLTRELARGLS